MAEFTTAVRYNMPITLVLLNNSQLGKISKEFLADEMEVWQTGLVQICVSNSRKEVCRPGT